MTLNLVRNGNAIVDVGFDDGPDGGTSASDGGGAPADGGGSGGSGPTFRELMQVAGVAGEVNLAAPSPFTGAFAIDSFTLDAKSAFTQGGGSAGGAGKTTWAASAIFRAQAGLADLIKDATTGKVISSVVLGRFTGGTMSTLLYEVTLTDVLISGVTAGSGAGDSILTQTVTFAFGGVTVEIAGSRRRPSTSRETSDLPPARCRRWNSSSAAPRRPPAEAVSAFIAPSETTRHGDRQRRRPGRREDDLLGDASVTFPFDLTALSILVSQFNGKLAPSAEVQLETAGVASPIGTYGFQNLQLHATTLSDANVTVSFGAQAFSWTFGGVTTTFP